ncbi:MAG TPA: hypothetical protein DCZ41_00570, partial [Firmicutes bacterium]|nr:hypothetical protein [Bacillota bacterium]
MMKNSEKNSITKLKGGSNMFDPFFIRKDFPMLRNNIEMQGKKLVWLDNASTTFKPDCVLDAVKEYDTSMTANSHRGDYDL